MCRKRSLAVGRLHVAWTLQELPAAVTSQCSTLLLLCRSSNAWCLAAAAAIAAAPAATSGAAHCPNLLWHQRRDEAAKDADRLQSASGNGGIGKAAGKQQVTPARLDEVALVVRVCGVCNGVVRDQCADCLHVNMLLS